MAFPGEVDGDSLGFAVQFFYEVDFTDPKVGYVVRRTDPAMRLPLLQSHGWLNGTLLEGTLEEAAARFNPNDQSTWPVVKPAGDLVFHDRYSRTASLLTVRVPLDKIRLPSAELPELSLVFVRWGGKARMGEDHSVEDEGDGGWGDYGSPPSDWYMAGVMDKGVMRHPAFYSEGKGDRAIEVLSLFLAGDADLKRIVSEAQLLCSELRGKKKTTWWMLWPADWPANWNSDGFIGYLERRSLFGTMRACEDAGIRTAFPHPSMLYEHITSKAWMATLSDQPLARLPAGILVSREDIQSNSFAAAKKAIRALEALRAKSLFASQGGPSVINKAGAGLQKGVVKLGWSWEARHVWFWTGEQQLAHSMQAMITLDGCLADRCIVQEWVDFDFELRLFFFPPRGWAPPVLLEPKHFSYTQWETKKNADSPGSFVKPSHSTVLMQWQGDEVAMKSAHEQAVEAAQFLIGDLLGKHSEAVPMIRMDFMCKRLGPGQAQVVFGEYCEMGACCLKWEEGPPTVWRAALDYALS